MHYLKTYHKEDLHLTASLQQLDGKLILNTSLHNLSDKPVLLRINSTSHSPFTLTLSPNFLIKNELFNVTENSYSAEPFSFLRLEHNSVVAKTVHFSLPQKQDESKNIISCIEVGYTPFGDGAWGEFPYKLTAVFFI